MKSILVFILSSALVFVSSASALTIQIETPDGHTVPNAVVIADTGPLPVTAEDFDWSVMLEQTNLQFAPYVLIAPVGSQVSFPNRDRVRHHVYSFSKGNQFEIELYGRDDSRFQVFSTPGVVAVGCNIHDDMIGYIRVVDTPFVGKTDSEGKVVFDALPADVTSVRVWHPDMKGGSDDRVFPLTGAATETFSLDVPTGLLKHGQH